MLFFIYRLKGGFNDTRQRVWPCLMNCRIWYLSEPKFTRNKSVISPDISGRYPKNIRRSSEGVPKEIRILPNEGICITGFILHIKNLSGWM